MEKSAITHKGRVFVVDDDSAVQRGVAALLKAAEYETLVFKSAEDFLKRLSDLNLEHAVILADVCMPGIQGLELQEQLKKDSVNLPVIVMTAHGDIPMAVRAMRNGAIDFLQKPFTVDEIVNALERALSIPLPSPKLLQNAPPKLIDRYVSLTPREKEVLREIVNGNTNKEIARILSISPRTIEVHRQKIMAKMNADSLAELVRMAVLLEFSEPFQ